MAPAEASEYLVRTMLEAKVPKVAILLCLLLSEPQHLQTVQFTPWIWQIRNLLITQDMELGSQHISAL